METVIIIENKEVTFSRNWFTGSFTYSVDGIKKTIESVFNLDTHYSVMLTKHYEGKIGNTTISIIKTRPLLLAGFRPHNYKFYIDKKLIKEIESL